ncbi:hypothetical protein COT30_04120 [Candidatus Micrarchaeota archaeon CG08_land_8_20_14_0_20_49_17]|nr:MAG: hypothetical protein AUJ13_01530 [Candidatus Micrarchaeota archaeon CG1_02_49_24]PIU09496.1 MAG: hypothetical protein COT30_04120 [Candidatus Micrarchaeota archaeon CG08_land_8_20_14_0_20_49_17]PIU81245.1 MAG: hypothetical protein COS70_05115 [Candidatus Micrarchaeota archaeon CG06_land_8_20_14_3_00_50_6]PIZ95904.1 MAG: hypothetical protein COX84_04215 [Candidatus Micrarchaeota archaeon CG_4_10_14_0_2_um_filter_49_7]HII54205.1 hypothetical protein [Candidatus Micrarchaeota archaeon]
MGFVRATIVIDEHLAARVRQAFEGNLSKGINSLLREHLQEKKNPELFGILKGKVSIRDLEAIDREEEEAERNDPLLRR